MALVNKGWYRTPWDGKLYWAVQDGENVFGFLDNHFDELAGWYPDGGLSKEGYRPMAPKFVNSFTFYPTREEAEAHVEKEPWE